LNLDRPPLFDAFKLPVTPLEHEEQEEKTHKWYARKVYLG